MSLKPLILNYFYREPSAKNIIIVINSIVNGIKYQRISSG